MHSELASDGEVRRHRSRTLERVCVHRHNELNVSGLAAICYDFLFETEAHSNMAVAKRVGISSVQTSTVMRAVDNRQ